MKRNGTNRDGLWRRLARIVVAAGVMAAAGVGAGGGGDGRLAAAQDEAQLDDPLAASTRTVNVELILDASGSMAETIPGTDETKIDAARRALAEVIAGIEPRDGLNVGFRVYGHEGSNQEADRAVSCQSTELTVPLDGVDTDALGEAAAGFEPTGWTPLALALEAAAADFEPGGESVTNAVILVTDGEETCGGDPCAVAGALNAAEVGLTTHVVGFALTPEQQEAVRCVAEEGGGQLFAADDADALSEAVFAALAQIEEAEATPVEVEVDLSAVGGYVGGNAFDLLGDGEPGELSVVAVGPWDGVHVPFVLRNNTGQDLEAIEAEAVARAGGELVGTGRAIFSIQPHVVEDGGFALGTISFDGELSDNVEYEFNLSATPAGSEEDPYQRDLFVEETNVVADSVVGVLSNPQDVGVANVVETVVCFDAAGGITESAVNTEARAIGDPVAPGDTIVFEVRINSVTGPLEGPCPVFLVAGGGSAAPE